jgi:hypothetical protein
MSCPSALNNFFLEDTYASSFNQGDLAFSSSFFTPLKSQKFFSRCGTNSPSENANGGSASVFGDVFEGMLDYDTRSW